MLAATTKTLQPGIKKFRQKKICHLSTVHMALDTRILFKECKALARHYDVDLIAPHDKKEVRNGVRIIPLPVSSSRLFRMSITNVLLVWKAIRCNASVYHFHDPELIPAGLILRLMGKKIIYDVHEFVLADMDEKSWVPFKRLVKFVYRQFEKLACIHFHLILAEDSYESHYRLRTSNITVIRNFADLRVLRQPVKAYNPGSNTLLFVGMLGARRGLPYIIEAISLLKNKGFHVNLLCIGKVDENVEHILKNSSAYQNVKLQIEFKGFLPVQEAYKYSRDCFAGLALSEDLVNHRKSFPTKLFEYMAVGLPVIASYFPLYKAIVQNNSCGLCINPANPAEIAAAIEKLFIEKTLSARMAENGRQAAFDFAWETEEKKLVALYNRILD